MMYKGTSIFRVSEKGTGATIVAGDIILQAEGGVEVSIPANIWARIEMANGVPSVKNLMVQDRAHADYNGKPSFLAPRVKTDDAYEHMTNQVLALAAEIASAAKGAEGYTLTLELNPEKGTVKEIRREVSLAIGESKQAKLEALAEKISAEGKAKLAAQLAKKASQAQGEQPPTTQREIEERLRQASK